MNIFFDLDGTLIDSQQRLFQLFQYLVEKSNLSFDEYWNLKRDRINHHTILTTKFGYTQSMYEDFEYKWMCEIELKRWLDLDVPFKGVGSLLSQFSKEHSIYIVTDRQNVKSTLDQVLSFSWNKYVSKTLVTEKKQEKFDLIKDNIIISSKDWFIGDTGKDINTGKKLGINTAAVLSGFMNERSLRQYQPDLIIENVNDLKFT
jgi:phosphoglycolate phosphatase